MSIRSDCFQAKLYVFFPSKFIAVIQKFMHNMIGCPLLVNSVGDMPLKVKGDYKRFTALVQTLI